jgi:hypothetical protein
MEKTPVGGVHGGPLADLGLGRSCSLRLHCEALSSPNTNTKSKLARRGTYGNGARFKFQEAGPLAGRLKGCAIHWSRGNAVLQCQQVSFRARAGQKNMCVPRREHVR